MSVLQGPHYDDYTGVLGDSRHSLGGANRLSEQAPTGRLGDGKVGESR